MKCHAKADCEDALDRGAPGELCDVCFTRWCRFWRRQTGVLGAKGPSDVAHCAVVRCFREAP